MTKRKRYKRYSAEFKREALHQDCEFITELPYGIELIFVHRHYPQSPAHRFDDALEKEEAVNALAVICNRPASCQLKRR